MEQLVREAPQAPADPQEEKGRRRRPPDAQQQSPRALTAELLALRQRAAQPAGAQREVRLDGERLGSIPPELRPALAEATHLHLQANRFESTRGLGGLPALRYLSLARNRVHEVAGLQELDSLAVLDLSHNQIRAIEPAELPPSLQVLRLAGNPLAGEEVAAALARALPLLRQVDRTKIAPASRDPSPESLSSSDGVTTALVEAAVAELEREDADSLPGAALFKQKSQNLARAEGLQSPIRVAPASRQGSSEVSSADAREAQEVAARIREALPSLRELVGASAAGADDALPGGARRSSSITAADGTALRPFRRLHTEDVTPQFRATLLPALGAAAHRSLSAGSPAAAAPGPHFPLAAPPPDFAAQPAEFQALLVGAISLLVGAQPPGAGHAAAPGASLVWQQVQQRRQQVLASLFAKRAPGQPDGSGGPDKGLQRADSVISRQGRRQAGSAINDEMLQGLHARDAPRAEGLSEAMLGPAPPPPRDQLAALSQDAGELAVAERARMSLRHGVCKMLDGAQARRAREPGAEAAVRDELRQLKQMASLQSVLATRDWHNSQHQHVLATLLGPHSRLGSITDRLGTKLAAPQQPPQPPPPPQDPAPRESSPVCAVLADGSVPQPLASPFEAPAAAAGHSPAAEAGDASPFAAAPAFPAASGPEPAATQPAAPALCRSQASSSSSSSSSTEAGGLLGRRASNLAAGLQATPGLQRRLTTRMSQPSRPAPPQADQEAEPPADRQSARVIFGGIAEQLTRGRSGQLGGGDAGAAASGRGRGPMSRAPSARPKPTPTAGSSLGRAATTEPDAERRAGIPPRPPQPSSMARARSQQLPPQQQQQPQQVVTVAHTTHSSKQQEEVEEELWVRFSGGGGSAARVVQASAPPGGAHRPEPQFTSPFSTFGGGGSLGAVSPFSQAPQPPQGPFQEAAAAAVEPEPPAAPSQPRPPAPSPFAAE